MKIWQVEESFGIERLALAEREAPAPGPGQARVTLDAWSLNYRDWMVVTGAYNPRIPFPFVPLSDGVGRVDAVGDGVTRVAPGDRVAATFAPGWLAGPPDRAALSSALGAGGAGMAAEQVVLDEEAWVKVPAHLSDAEAATLPCAAVTAWNALFGLGEVGPGQTVLVQGTGGVSLFALQLAQLAGARVVATSSSKDKLARVRELGAWQTIDYVEDERWGKTAKKLTGGGVDHVVEVGGAGTIEQSLVAVRPGGTISVIGVLEGTGGPVQLTRVLMNAVRMQGIFVGPRAAFEDLCRALEAHQARPLVDRAFGFEELPAALEYLKSGAHFGKIALTRA